MIIPTLTISDEKTYKELFLVYDSIGVKKIRINLTRYEVEEYTDFIQEMDNVQSELFGYRKLEYLFDIPFPGDKMRVCFDGNSDRVFIKKNDLIYIYNSKHMMDVTQKKFFVKHFEYLYKSNINEIVEIDDGKLLFSIISKESNCVVLKAHNSGFIKYMKTINARGRVYFINTSEEESYKWREIISKLRPSGVVFSFLNSVDDIKLIKEKIIPENDTIEIIPKIETPEGINNLNDILNNVNMIMFGRGDMALTASFTKLGYYQELLLSAVKSKGKKVIVATDIMASFCGEDGQIPNRGDLIDLDNLLNQRVDYLAFSGDLSLGNNIKTIDRIIREIKKIRKV